MINLIITYIMLFTICSLRQFINIKCLKEVYFIFIFVMVIPINFGIKDNFILLDNIPKLVRFYYILYTISIISTILSLAKIIHLSILITKIKRTEPIFVNSNIYKNKSVCTPCTIGVLKPIILLPHTEYSDEELYMILKHEKLHIKNRDNLLLIVLDLFRSMMWFMPFKGKVIDSIKNEIEIRCDLELCKNINEEECIKYGHLLVNNLEVKRTSNLVAYLSDKTSIIRRMKNIRYKDLKNCKFTLSTICIVIIFTVLLSKSLMYVNVGYSKCYVSEHNNKSVNKYIIVLEE